MTRLGIGGALAVVGLVGALSLSFPRSSASQDRAPTAQDQYRIGENSQIGADEVTANSGPVRMGRLSQVKGDVAYRPDSAEEWTEASVNLPVRQGGQVWVKHGSRAEVQFDDGSHMRLGGGALATLQSMYSDDRGEFTEVKMDNGLASMDLRNKLSEYQLDTPNTSLRACGPSDFRVGVGDSTEVVVRAGSADLIGDRGDESLNAGQRVLIDDQTSPYTVSEAPAPDSWDQWNEQCDQNEDVTDPHLPSNIDLVAGDLQNYGDWRNDSQYGDLWVPRDVPSDWRPYQDGHWAWVSPFGWTWCDNRPWGWAPSHYGTWVQETYGWAWCPGPAQQYWSPAVVQFTDCSNQIGWWPLAPSEVRYPSVLSIGFNSGNWALNFSIGAAGCYFPQTLDYCVARPWANSYCNGSTNVYNITNITNIYNTTNVLNTSGGFCSQNAFGGAVVATRSAFANGGLGSAYSGSGVDLFRRGHGFTNPQVARYLSGPAVTPTRSAFTGGFAGVSQPPKSILSRTVVSAPVPVAIAQRRTIVGSVATQSHRTITGQGFGGERVAAPATNPNRYERLTSVSHRPTETTTTTRDRSISRDAGTATPKTAQTYRSFAGYSGNRASTQPATATTAKPAHQPSYSGFGGYRRQAQSESTPAAPAQTYHRPSYSGFGGYRRQAQSEPTPAVRPTQTYRAPSYSGFGGYRQQAQSEPTPAVRPTQTYRAPSYSGFGGFRREAQSESTPAARPAQTYRAPSYSGFGGYRRQAQSEPTPAARRAETYRSSSYSGFGGYRRQAQSEPTPAARPAQSYHQPSYSGFGGYRRQAQSELTPAARPAESYRAPSYSGFGGYRRQAQAESGPMPRTPETYRQPSSSGFGAYREPVSQPSARRGTTPASTYRAPAQSTRIESRPAPSRPSRVPPTRREKSDHEHIS